MEKHTTIIEFHAWAEKHDWLMAYYAGPFPDGRYLEHWLSPRGDYFVVQYWKDGRVEIRPYREHS